jgi:hypothetical protein
MAIWQLHYAFINDDVRVQFYFTRVLKLTSSGGFTTCYNFICASSNNLFKMSDELQTYTQQRACLLSVLCSARNFGRIRYACGRNEIQYTKRKTGKYGPMYDYMYNFIREFFLHVMCNKKQAIGNNRNIHIH